MLLDDVIGLDDVKQHLTEMVQQNRLSHALLFLGKEGTGALPLAIAFAQYIVCQPTAAPEAADLFGGFTPMSQPAFVHPNRIHEQESYHRANKLMHPDLHFSYPVIPKKPSDKPISTHYIEEWRAFIQHYPYGNVYDWLQFIGAENKQGNITAEECNEIIKKLNLKSFESEYKVLVMWMPEYLGKEGNKLLKLIEEPPANTLFILVAENEEQILPTILSRCQLVKIPKITTQAMQEALVTKAKIEPEKATQIAAIANGNYREALQLIQHAEEDWLHLLREWFNTVAAGSTAQQVKMTDELSKLGREKQKQLLRYCNHILEQCLRLKIMGHQNVAMIEAEKEFAYKLNKITTVSQQQAIAQATDKASYFIERNANAKMLFQALTIRLSYIIRNKTLILTN